MGPLQGFKIVEIAGIGPTQLCGMLLADMGAQLIRVCRASGDEVFGELPPRYNLMNRGRHTVVADLKSQTRSSRVSGPVSWSGSGSARMPARRATNALSMAA